MNLRTLGIVGASALLGLCLSLVVSNSVSAQRSAESVQRSAEAAQRGPATVGRFKLEMATGLGTFMYDTTIGECWRWDGEAWEAMGIPKPPAAQ